ncbi:type VI secretion system accessory protein TagJ [Methylococcus sp. EFPC2]|uniref:type VI secretion system accessory protein TagJ n=1 Tax=Methylococcus sp. EFPC2 TaxID=2812648 RepID=UPI001F07F419|nr:type VI secretion system accessory protein TagJ [Methylococcus sp. EFPC2]
MDVDTLAMVQAYRETLRCEALRADVFAGQRLPLLFGDPEQWSALQFEALRLDIQGRHAEARALLQQVFDLAPATAGRIDGQPFSWIADADTRLGPVLEAIVKGKYYWIPFHRISAIKITPPADLRDLVWLPAHFVWSNGGESFGFIPSRYPASESSPDNAIRLARKTEWTELAEGHYRGSGQRMLTTDQGDHALLDIREIELDTAQA